MKLLSGILKSKNYKYLIDCLMKKALRYIRGAFFTVSRSKYFNLFKYISAYFNFI